MAGATILGTTHIGILVGDGITTVTVVIIMVGATTITVGATIMVMAIIIITMVTDRMTIQTKYTVVAEEDLFHHLQEVETHLQDE